MLELYDKLRHADYYKLSPLSYAIIANTFRMNVPIPEKLTPSETYMGMRIPIAEAQSSIAEVVTSLVEPGKIHEQTQSPAVQAPQDRRVMDQTLVAPNTTTQDRQTREDSPTAQDRCSPTKAERPDELVETRNEASGLVSLTMRAIRHLFASENPKGKLLFY